jgi:tetratricopeptide (TPR) repeat protein
VTRTLALALLLLLGFGTSVAMARVLDGSRLGLRARVVDEAPYLAPGTTRLLSLAFGGLVADWYWLSALQYVGRKIQEQAQTKRLELEQAIELDRIEAVDPRVLVRFFDTITTLDPRFLAVYEFGAVVLPAVDPQAAVALLEKGIRANPDRWYLHQQLAYIFWQRGDYLAAADAFRRGARMTTARWMTHMAERMEQRGDDPQVAHAMYARMYEQAQDEQVRQWALKRLMELRSLQEREAIRRVLSGFVTAEGRCPQAWTELAPELGAAGLTLQQHGAPLDPTGTPYVLVLSPLGCDVVLHRLSTVPRG